MPERKLDSLEAFLERFPAVKRVMIDGTERPIQRPQDPEALQSNDADKKKRHTRKHLAAVDETKRVLVLSKAREDRLHDKRFHDEDDLAGNIPTDILLKWLESFSAYKRSMTTSIYRTKNREGAS